MTTDVAASLRRLANLSPSDGKYSQSYQDSVLHEIVHWIRLTEGQRWAVELGFNADSLTGGSGSNVARLIRDHGWRSMLVSPHNANPAINLIRHDLATNSVTSLLSTEGLPTAPGCISIVTNANDLWLFRTLAQFFRAAIFVVRYNPNLPLSVSVTQPNRPEPCTAGRAFGASLGALNAVASETGYTLVWVVRGLDAIYVRSDLLHELGEPCAIEPSSWAESTGIPFKAAVTSSETEEMLDYLVFRETKGDIEAARFAAQLACQRYLVG